MVLEATWFMKRVFAIRAAEISCHAGPELAYTLVAALLNVGLSGIVRRNTIICQAVHIAEYWLRAGC